MPEARRAGIRPILLDPFGDWPDPGCAKIATLTELPARLRSPEGK